MNKTDISVTIITLNEEDNLPRCLNSLLDIGDEIILVDSGSSDQTIEIAKSYNCKIFKRSFDNFANQKNFALSKTSSDWIFSIDADEVVTPELITEIKQAVQTDKFSAFLIPRRNFILGAEIKHSRWSPDKHIWLWRKDRGRWIGEVHEEVVINGLVGELKNAKLHYQNKTVGEFIRTNNKYSSLQAQRLIAQGVKFSFLRMVWEANFEFFVRFFYKLGFLDGWRGLVLAMLMSYYKLQVWVKILKLQINHK